MRPKLKLFVVLFAMVLACFSLAQGGGGGGFGGGRQRGGPRGNPTSITSIVFRADVQTDLGLTDEEKTKLTEMRQSLRPPQRNQGDPPLTPEDRAALEETNSKKVEAILTADQVTRLHEIQIQLMGAQALMRKSVQSDLGLSADQISKLEEINKTYQAAVRSVRQKQRTQEIDQATYQADMKKNSDELKTEAEKVLTSDQVTKFHSMGGKPFVSAAPPTN